MNYGSKQIRKKIKSLRSPYEKIGRKAVVLFFKLITVCIVVCFVMLTCVGLGAFTGIIETAPQISLDAVSPQWYQSYIYDSNGNKVETLVASGSNRIEASIDDMPKHLINDDKKLFNSRSKKRRGLDAPSCIQPSWSSSVSIDLYFISSSAIIVEQRMKFTSLINSLFISYPQRSFCNPVVFLL